MPTSHVRHPNPLNQFYRLDYDEVRRVWVKTSRWNDVVNGVNLDSANCMATEGAVALDAHAGIHTTPIVIRGYGGDLVGGMGVDDVKTAWDRKFDMNLLTPDWQDWSEVIAAIKARRHVAAGGDYGYLPEAYKRQAGGDFAHAFGLDDYDAGQILVYDSLGVGPQWTPESAIRPAIEALARQERGTAGRLFVGYTAIRPPLAGVQEYRVSITGRTQLYYGINGRADGIVSRATYICTRSKAGGLWWYTIRRTGSGRSTTLAGRAFKPNRYTRVSYA